MTAIFAANCMACAELASLRHPPRAGSCQQKYQSVFEGSEPRCISVAVNCGRFVARPLLERLYVGEGVNAGDKFADDLLGFYRAEYAAVEAIATVVSTDE